jgi:hypothetical protein
MQKTSLQSEWPASCPECETELNQHTGVCPACSWERSSYVAQVAPDTQDEGSYSERYNGTSHAARLMAAP